MRGPSEMEEFVSKLVLFRLVLSGALVSVAIAEIFGLTNGTSSQLLAGSIGAVSVAALKSFHFL